MIFVDESLSDSRPGPAGFPPCTQNCAQGRACPARHPPPDRSTAGGLEPFGDEDADGLGVFRGLMVACALTAAGWAVVIALAALRELLR